MAIVMGMGMPDDWRFVFLFRMRRSVADRQSSAIVFEMRVRMVMIGVRRDRRHEQGSMNMRVLPAGMNMIECAHLRLQ